jgi:hypothetical protein
VSDATDCDDGDSAVSPSGIEVCDSADNDCDGSVDGASAVDAFAYYIDADGDGFGDETSEPIVTCEGAPVGYRIDGLDCDDTSVLVHPYAYDAPGGSVDADCDGSTDPRVTWMSGTSGDDSSTTISPSAFTFPFCGAYYGAGGGSLNMISNGRLTLGGSDTDFSESLSDLTGDVAIMPHWDDLYTDSSSQLQYAEFEDAMTFAWVKVSECCSTSTSANATFMATLFEDGRVLLSYGANTLAGSDGIVGWACTPPSTPSSMDLSAISYPAGYWGFGAGTEEAIVQQFSSSAPDDLVGTAVRFCANADGTLDHCVE